MEKVSKVQALIDQGSYVPYGFTTDNRLKGRFVCKLCTGFRANTILNKESIVSHHSRYHVEETGLRCKCGQVAFKSPSTGAVICSDTHKVVSECDGVSYES